MNELLTTTDVAHMLNAYRGYRYPFVRPCDIRCLCLWGALDAKRCGNKWLIPPRIAKRFVQRQAARIEYQRNQREYQFNERLASCEKRGRLAPDEQEALVFMAMGGDPKWLAAYNNDQQFNSADGDRIAHC
jgi:hypothetical protein